MAYDYNSGVKLFSTTSSPRVVFIGDSITANGAFTTSQEIAYNDIGYSAWVRRLCADRIYSPVSFNFGVSGWITAEILGNQIPLALAQSPDIAVVMAGRNDAQTGIVAGPDTKRGSTQYNLRKIYDALQDAGVIVIAVKILSQTFSEWPASANELLALNTNNWIDTQKSFRRGFYVVDCGQAYDDQTSTTHWVPKTGYINASDNTHPASWGAYAIGNQIATLINTLYPSWRLRQQNVDDVYDAVNNPYGSLLPNQMFTGSGGSTSGGTTGTVATGWTLFGQNLISAAAAGSKSTTSDGRITQVVTISGTANGSNGFVSLQAAATATNCKIGETIEGSVDVSYGATTNIMAVEAFIQTEETGIFYTKGDGKSSLLTPAVGYSLPTDNAASGSPALSSLAYQLRTPQHTFQDAPTSVQLWLRMWFLNPISSGTVAGTFSFASPSLKKVPPVSQ